ncbi:hypothetical protein GCM10009786_06080 [Leucobacter alluvii]|uniref:Alpha-tubulin suppressor-like RCC1 family protein n=1 Tax=Leucobacter alluvii TaxID=340321 RepID=A0ABP5MU14_9MICO
MGDKVRKFRVSSRKAFVGLTTAALAVTTLSIGATTAGFQSTSYARAELATEATVATPPVYNDQSAGSVLFINRFGELFLGGDRRSGNGAGAGNTAPTADPTKVEFPDGVKIVDAGGSTNDFHWNNVATGYSAIDTEGRVWTWGQVYPGGTRGIELMGRGNISLQASYTPGQVVTTAEGTPLPKIIDLQRSENQTYALDETGTMWVWGYGGENLPVSASYYSGNGAALPTRANTTAVQNGMGDCRADRNPANHGGDVTWHTIWGGNNSSGGVSTSGLIYTWGYDASNGIAQQQWSQRCPQLNEGANRVLFEQYPDLYRTADGKTYDPAELTTEALRNERYSEIVAHMTQQPLAQCATPTAKSIVDATECPVRQFGYSARAGRLLLQNGSLYTWMISNDQTYGYYFLGREGSTNQNDLNSRFRPNLALSNVNFTSPQVGSVSALTHDGKVYGWGRNNYCQAVGERTVGSADCGSNAGNDFVILPRPVAGIPQDATITGLSSNQCTTWARSDLGTMWAWGGGTMVSNNYVFCGTTGSAYGIYDQRKSTLQAPFGAPVRSVSTGTMPILD